MKDKLKKFINGNIALSVALIILGIVIAIFPGQTIFFFTYGSGVIMLIYGIYLLISDRKSSFNPYEFSFLGVALLVFGINSFINPERIAVFLPVILGIWFISSSISKLRISIGLKSANKKLFISALILSFVSMGIGIYFVVNPMGAGETVMMILGILLAVYATCDLVNMVIFKKYFDMVNKYFNDKTDIKKIKEGEVVETDKKA